MKQIIKLNESDIHRIIMESLNELSPEFLAHAANVADEKENRRKRDIFNKGAVDALHRDFGFEKQSNADNYKGPSGHTATHSFGGTHAGGYKQFLTVDNNDKSMSLDDPKGYAENWLKAGPRNKVKGASAAIERMNKGLDPKGNPYPTNESINRAVKNTFRKFLK